jgi:hypothetical protein
MSFKLRAFWIYPMIFLASWLAVRSLGATPEVLDDPPGPVATARSAPREIRDAGLERFIGRLAAVARSRAW